MTESFQWLNSIEIPEKATKYDQMRLVERWREERQRLVGKQSVDLFIIAKKGCPSQFMRFSKCKDPLLVIGKPSGDLDLTVSIMVTK